MRLDYIDPAELTDPSASQLHSLGDQYRDPLTQTLYEYVQYKVGAGPVAAAQGVPVGVYKSGGSPFVVTGDISDSNAAAFRGVTLGAVTANYYCWIAHQGPASMLVDDTGAISAPAPLKWSGDGAADAATIGTDHIIASLLADVANDANGADLKAVNLL